MERRQAEALDRYITGNYGEDQMRGDAEWEKVFEQVSADADRYNLTDIDVSVAWQLGLAAWIKAREYGCKFPHDPSE